MAVPGDYEEQALEIAFAQDTARYNQEESINRANLALNDRVFESNKWAPSGKATLSDGTPSAEFLGNIRADVTKTKRAAIRSKNQADKFMNETPSHLLGGETREELAANNADLEANIKTQTALESQLTDKIASQQKTVVTTGTDADGFTYTKTATVDRDYQIPDDEKLKPGQGEDQTLNGKQLNSAGDIVDNEAKARADGAGTQTPYPDHLSGSDNQPGETVTNSNADETKTLETSQNVESRGPVLEDNLQTGSASASADDKGSAESNQFVSASSTNGVETAKAFYENIEARPNPLGQYSQLTYNIGLYLLSPQQYKQLLVSETKSVQGYKKILQSGGNNITDDVIFPDLFIDDLDIETVLPEVTMSPNTVVKMNFNIIEPMGYTFFKRLRQLCIDNNMSEFSKQHYLMVIKFTGFDENGKAIPNEDSNRLTKFIPFLFTRIKTSLRGGGITYQCQAVATNHDIGLSTRRATIPFNVELLGQTLNDLFNSTSAVTPNQSTSQTTATSPFGTTETTVTPGLLTNSAGTPGAGKGIVEALNKQQKKLAKELGYKIPDQYKVTFHGGIGDKQIISSDSLLKVKNKAPMSAPLQAAANSLLSSGVFDKTRQLYSIPAGMQIHQLLDIMIRSSKYITDQQTHEIDPKTGEVVPRASQDVNKFLQWYNIGIRATPIEWDDKRNDYAYEIEYIVTPKLVAETYSPFFPKAPFRNVHKTYAYWFTGENTEVLNYEQELNTSFFVAMDGRIPLPTKQASVNDQRITSYAYVNKSGAAGLGQPGDNASPAEQAADVIYSTVDFVRFNMDIIADPDFIQQTDVLYASGQSYDAFLPDGSINYNSQEVLVEVKFRTMEDYNDVTGGADLKDPLFVSGSGATTRGLIYKVFRVRSKFNKGTMVQSLQGVLRQFEEDNTAQEDTQRENTLTTNTGRTNGNSIAGAAAITEGGQNYAPNFNTGNQIAGQKAVTDMNQIGPNYNEGVFGSAGVGGNQAITEGEAIGPNFRQGTNFGNDLPGASAVTYNDQIGPNLRTADFGNEIPGAAAINANSIGPNLRTANFGNEVPGQNAVTEGIQGPNGLGVPPAYGLTDLRANGKVGGGDEDLVSSGLIVDTIPPTGPVGGVRRTPPESEINNQ